MIIYKVSSAGARTARLPGFFSKLFQNPPTSERTKTDNIFLQDIITDDEIISDTYELKEIDDAVYQVDCKRVTRGVDNIGQFSPLPPRLRRLTARELE